MWNIQKIVKKGEYLYAVVPGHPRATSRNYVLHHRVVMENHLGRLLEPDEVVHHINHDKHDNRIENLEVMTHVEHSLHHVKRGRTMVDLICAFCSKEFKREKAQVKPGNTMCSRRCNGLYNRHIGNWRQKK